MCSLNNLSITHWWHEYKEDFALVISLLKNVPVPLLLEPMDDVNSVFPELSYAVNGISVFESGHNSQR